MITLVQEELIQEADQIVDIASEVARPRLLAILFCDWVNETPENKANLIGAFDRLFVQSDSRLTPPFTLYIRATHVHEGPTLIRVFQPDGRVGLEAAVEPPEVTEGTDEPENLQVIARMQFVAEQVGTYWVEVSYRGQSLGGAPLVVQLRDIDNGGHGEAEGAE